MNQTVQTTEVERPRDGELAGEIGISKGTFSMVKSGKRKLSVKTQELYDAVVSPYERAERYEAAVQEAEQSLVQLGKLALENF